MLRGPVFVRLFNVNAKNAKKNMQVNMEKWGVKPGSTNNLPKLMQQYYA